VGGLSPMHWLIVIVVAMLLFGGARRLPELARAVGRSARILRSELTGPHAPPAHVETPPAPPGGHRASLNALQARPEPPRGGGIDTSAPGTEVDAEFDAEVDFKVDPAAGRDVRP
jgi:sec-independent protein translocase protein TatA